MSGIDVYTRLYIRFDEGVTDFAFATDPDGVFEDYPHFSVGQILPTDEGVFDGIGFNIYSYEPTMVPTRSMTYWFVEDRSNPYAPYGLYALYYGDYTIDFWVKVNPAALGYQPIFGNASGWKIYYEDGVLHQQQGSGHHVSCSCDLTGSFHHVEFNRSLGVNRIFIDGVLQELSSDLWNPVASNLYSFYVGCIYYSFRDVDLVIDEMRFSTGVARHTEDFDVPTEAYTRLAPVTEIPSPIDGTISFFLSGQMNYEVLGDSVVVSPVSSQIRIIGDFLYYLEIPPDSRVLSITNGRIRFEALSEFDSGFYGLTIPAIQNGTILLESMGSIVTEGFTSTAIVIGEVSPETIYDLISNVVEIPASLIADIETTALPALPDLSWTFRLLNAVETDISFFFINALNFDLENSFLLKNSLTGSTLVSFSSVNRMLATNELLKNFTLLSRILTSDPVVGIPEQYTGFYFSKIHGV